MGFYEGITESLLEEWLCHKRRFMQSQIKDWMSLLMKLEQESSSQMRPEGLSWRETWIQCKRAHPPVSLHSYMKPGTNFHLRVFHLNHFKARPMWTPFLSRQLLSNGRKSDCESDDSRSHWHALSEFIPLFCQVEIRNSVWSNVHIMMVSL